MYAVLGAKAAIHRNVSLAWIATRNFPSFLAGAYLGSDIQVMPEAVCVDTGLPVGFGTVPLEKSPITGGTVAGPKLKGQVVPGGFDFQLTYTASDCTQLSADYFLKAEDGTVIHVFNEGLVCPGGERSLFRPRLEAPKGPHEWLTRATFVATLEVEPSGLAVRIRFYQVK